MTTATTDTPAKAKKAPKAKASPHVKLSSVYVAVAKKRDISTTDAAKSVRGLMRANFAEVCKLSPNVAKAKDHANDGKRWPETVTRKLAERILNGKNAS